MSAADLPAARPVVDRDALAEVVRPIVGGAWAYEVAGRVLTIVQDAADVRRAVAAEIAAAIETSAGLLSMQITAEAMRDAARIAREAGERE